MKHRYMSDVRKIQRVIKLKNSEVVYEGRKKIFREKWPVKMNLKKWMRT